MTKTIAILVVALALAGCNAAQNYQPIIDWRKPGYNAITYQRDLADCRRYAEAISPAEGAFAGGLLGALAGAAIGAATGAVAGDPGGGALVGVAAGGSSGIIAGGATGTSEQVRVVRACLQGRGHPVLN